eukprot:Skav226399  [mRNA]  locus=scaffold3989:55255:57380:- [translate_table: standard]
MTASKAAELMRRAGAPHRELRDEPLAPTSRHPKAAGEDGGAGGTSTAIVPAGAVQRDGSWVAAPDGVGASRFAWLDTSGGTGHILGAPAMAASTQRRRGLVLWLLLWALAPTAYVAPEWWRKGPGGEG